MKANGKTKKIDYNSWTKPELVREIEKLNKRKKYGLIWDEERTKEIFEEEVQKKLPVLKEDKKREIIKTKNNFNILIEGDNYHALSVLNYTHKRKIDAIYIDPPYNTGNNTWKYNNKFIEEDDPFKHSKWINFMSKRLRLASKLLTKNGIICVTIDNYEIHNLRHIMEDIFSNRDVIVTVIQHNFRGRAKNNFALTHEYVLWAIPKEIELITRLNEKSLDIKRNLRRTGQGSKREDSPTMFFGIEVNHKTLEIVSVTEPIFDKKLPTTNNENTEYVFPIDNDGIERRWYYSPKTVLSEIKQKNIWAKKIRGRIEIHYWKSGKEKRRKSVWTGSKYDSSTFGSELLTEIIGDNDFPFPKSIYAVKECIQAMTNKKDAIILDFFAGSGTTGHAVLELNKEDNGNRKFILCTNNENNICDEITYVRLSKIINGYSFNGKQKDTLFERGLSYSKLPHIYDEIKNVKIDSHSNFNKFEITIKDKIIKLIGINEIKNNKIGLKSNLKYFRTTFVDSEPTSQNKKIMVEQSTEMLCLKEDCFELVKKGRQFAVFRNSDERYLGIVYYYDGIEPFKREVRRLNRKISTYVFSLGDEADEEEFEDIRSLVTLKPIPSAILNVYRRIFAYVQTKKLSGKVRK